MIVERLFPYLLLVAAIYGLRNSARHRFVNATLPVSSSTYDYIVVGAGAAGLVAPERLAQTGKSVLLLERGGPSLYTSGGGGSALTPWNDTLTVYDVPALFMSLIT